jgi:hypothetical protein
METSLRSPAGTTPTRAGFPAGGIVDQRDESNHVDVSISRTTQPMRVPANERWFTLNGTRGCIRPMDALANHSLYAGPPPRGVIRATMSNGIA